MTWTPEALMRRKIDFPGQWGFSLIGRWRAPSLHLLRLLLVLLLHCANQFSPPSLPNSLFSSAQLIFSSAPSRALRSEYVLSLLIFCQIHLLGSGFIQRVLSIANSAWFADIPTLVLSSLIIKAKPRLSPPTNGWRNWRRCPDTCRTSKHQSHRQSQWSFLQDQANNPAEEAYGCLLRASRQTGFNCAFSVWRNTSSSWRLSRHGTYSLFFFLFSKVIWKYTSNIFLSDIFANITVGIQLDMQDGDTLEVHQEQIGG